DIRRLVLLGDILGVHDVDVSAPDRLVVDLAALVASVGAADRSNIHPLLHPVSIEDRIPGRRSRLDAVTALDGYPRGCHCFNRAPELLAHLARELAAIVLVRAVYLDMLERKQTAQRLDMGARLPAAAEQAEHSRPRRREIPGSDRTHGGHAHFL